MPSDPRYHTTMIVGSQDEVAANAILWAIDALLGKGIPPVRVAAAAFFLAMDVRDVDGPTADSLREGFVLLAARGHLIEFDETLGDLTEQIAKATVTKASRMNNGTGNA